MPLFDKAETQNKLLRSVAGGGVEVLNQLQARWDKFELMMESHQLMVKEQVIIYPMTYLHCRTWTCIQIQGMDNRPKMGTASVQYSVAIGVRIRTGIWDLVRQCK